MSKTVQWKRGNANVSTAYIGAQGEITVDTSEWALRLHDGLTPGGFKISNDTDGNVDLGNIRITDQTIQGKNSNQDVNINASGNANVVLFGQSTVISNDIYVQGNATLDGIIIQSNTISTVNPAGNLILSSSLGNVITPARFFANSIRLTNENFYIEQVFNNFLNRNVVSLYSAINNAQDFTIRANNTFLGYHASPFGAVGIRTFASNTVPVTILGNTSIIGNLTSDSYRTSNEYSSYSFASNTGNISGLQHRLFSANVNVLALIHDNFEVARFLSNSLTQLTGNVIITGGAGVQNIADFPEGRLQVYSNVNTYSQIVHQNLSQGNTASSDYVATANNGDDTTFYVDLGIAGNLHTDPNFFGDTTTFNDAYLYVTGYDQAGPSLGNIGNLIIGSTNGIVKTFIGNTAEANVITVVDSTGLLPGANVTYSLGSSTRQWKDLWVSNNTIYIGGVALGVSADGNLTVNGNAVSGGGNVSLGNFIFSGNNIYNLNGGSFNNGDLSHGSTASLTLPVNGLTNSVALQNTYGNITLGAGANASITSSWLFNNNGILTLPGGAVAIGSQYGSEAILATDTSFGVATQGSATTYLNWSDNVANTSVLAAIYVNSPGATAGNIQIRTGNVGSPNNWLFGTTGNLELPSEGNIVGITSHNAGYLKWVGNSSGDGNGYSTIQLFPDSTVAGNDQYIIVDPTAPGHIHIRAGGTQDNSYADLILGGENSYFKIAAGSNAQAQISANSHSWTFGVDGTFTLPTDAGLNGSQINSISNSSGDLNGYTTLQLIPDVTLGTGSDQYLIIDPTAPGHIHIRAGGTQDNSSADLILGGEYSHVRIPAGANSTVYIKSNDYNWQFGSDGVTSFPSGITFPSGGNLIFDSSAVSMIDGISTIQFSDSSIQTTAYPGTNVSLTLTGNLTVGNLTVNGNATYINTNSYVVDDNIIQMANANPGDTLDIGFAGHRTVASILQHTGLVRDASENTWKLFSNVIPQPGTTVDFTNAIYDDLTVGNLVTNGNITVNDTLIIAGGIQPFGASPAPSLSGFSSISTVISGNPNEGNITAHNYLRANGGIITTGNITGGNLSITGNISAQYFAGNGSLLTGVDAENSATIDILNTNGLSTVFYPTFVEDRTNGQILRADVDLTYRTDDNILTVQNISSSGNISATYFIGNGALLTGISGGTGNYDNSNVITLLGSLGSNTIVTSGNVTVGNLITGNGINGYIYLGNANSRLTQIGSNSYATFDQNIVFVPDTNKSALAGVVIGGNGYLLGPNGVRNITLNYGSVSGAVGLQANATVGTGGSGTLTVAGTATTGINAILAGPTFTPLANTSAGFVSSVNSYSQITFQNKSTGADATADYILTADNGSDTANYGDFGIINSGYDNATPTNSLGNIVYAADTYLYAQGNVGNVSQSGGNLAIGTTVAGKTVRIFAGGANASSIIATVSNTGMTVTGNISVSGNITGTTPNVNLVAGSYTHTFDNTGNVTIAGSGIRMPSRPAMRVYGNTSTYFGVGTTITGANFIVDYNQASALNASTGIFTAPVAGLYSVTLVARVGNNNGLNQVAILKNDSTSGANVICFWETDTSSNTAVHFGSSGVANLAIGDTLRTKVLAGNIQFDSNDSWTVTYIG